ncbi:MAG: FG-GAP-like repeat-containing protein [Polyangiales bacterium]
MRRLAPLLALLSVLLLIGCPESSPGADAASDALTPVDADAGPRCEPDSSLPCACINGVPGTRSCHPSGVMGFCTCVRPPEDGGVTRPLPPRLVFPLSDTRVTSQRPTLRWVLPEGVTRARVELCADRACTRSLVRQEVSGGAWRSPRALTPGVVFWHVQGLSAGGAVTWSSATWEFQVRHRDIAVDSAYGTLHDFNGDGFDDVVAGTNNAPSIQELHVFHGAATGIQTTAAAILTAPGRSNPRDGRAFGEDVAVGDYNGDGFADVAVTEEYYETPAGSGMSNRGRVWLFSGGWDGLDASRYQEISFESEMNARLSGGSALADFNGDGFDDLLATRAPGHAGTPEALLFLGGVSALQSAPVSFVQSRPYLDLGHGAFVRGVGDVDGDGFGDFALGFQYGNVGEPGIVIFHGNSQGLLDERIEEIPVIIGLPNLGRKVAGANFNGDAFGDVFASSFGPLSVLRGTAAGLEADSEILAPHGNPKSTEGIFGWTLGVQGDLNGDGYTDLTAAGNCYRGNNRPDFYCYYGVTYLFACSRGGVPSAPDHFIAPASVTAPGFVYPISPGDVNGDGIDDLLIEVEARPAGFNVYYGGPWDWTTPSNRVRETSDIRLGMWLY